LLGRGAGGVFWCWGGGLAGGRGVFFGGPRPPLLGGGGGGGGGSFLFWSQTPQAAASNSSPMVWRARIIVYNLESAESARIRLLNSRIISMSWTACSA